MNAAVEIPLMILFPRIARRFRVEWLIVAGIAVIVLRSVLWALAVHPLTFIAVTALSGVSFTFMLVGTTSYIASRVPASLQATAQALFTSTTFAIGSIGGAIIAGQVAQVSGLGGVYPASAAIAVVAAVLAWWAIARPTPSRPPPCRPRPSVAASTTSTRRSDPTPPDQPDVASVAGALVVDQPDPVDERREREQRPAVEAVELRERVRVRDRDVLRRDPWLRAPAPGRSPGGRPRPRAGPRGRARRPPRAPGG